MKLTAVIKSRIGCGKGRFGALFYEMLDCKGENIVFMIGFDVELPFVAVGERDSDGEAETDAVTGFVGLIETVKNMRQFFFRNEFAVVFDGDF